MLALPKLLLLSMIALMAGAAAGILLKERGWGIAALKGLMASFLGGLLVLHLLPEAYEKIGPLSLVLVAAGFLCMVLPERLIFRHTDADRPPGRFFTAEMLWIGLFLHQVTDGVGLAVASESLTRDWRLALVVIAHHIPVAAVVVWLYRRENNAGQAWIRILCMGLATIVGAVLSQSLSGLLTSGAVDMVYAFMAGAFLHLISHNFLDHHAHSQKDRHWEFLAFMVGVGFLFLAEMLPLETWTQSTPAATGEASHTHGQFDTFLSSFVFLVKETAPYLLLGLIISGLVHAYMPQSPIRWLKRGGPLTQSFKGMAFGLPLPICSCGVLPLFLGLARKGLPPACLVAFLIATPELGIDSFLLSVKLLGWKFSVVRLIVAIILPVVIALVAVRFMSTPQAVEPPRDCCEEDHQVPARPAKWWRFAAVDLVDDIFPFVFFGLLVAALAQTVWPVSSLSEMVGGWDVLLLGLLGIPFYVCASASIPFALILLQHGFSVGAVVVFLFAGPATNVATVLTVNKAFGGKAGLKLAGIAFLVAVGAGFLINLVYTPGSLDVLQIHEHGWSFIDYVSVAAIAILGLLSLYRSGPLHWISNVVGMIPGIIHHPPTEAEAGH